MANKKACEVTVRDYKLLRFLWKWKIVSTRGLARKFFPEAQPFTAYRRLLVLEANGYIGSYPMGGQFNYAWILKEKGFKYILPHLGELRSKGYKSSNYPHDFLASAFHLGEWLTYQPSNSQTYSEQQLRCYSEEVWPSWVPSSTMHRPDGYSAYQWMDRQTIIAFEAELSIKAKNRYESIIAFYDTQPTIDYVLWLADSRTTLNALQGAFKKFQVRNGAKHQFLLDLQFQQSGWMSQIVEGSLKGQTPSHLLFPAGHTIPTQSPLTCVTPLLLDTRRRPNKSKT